MTRRLLAVASMTLIAASFSSVVASAQPLAFSAQKLPNTASRTEPRMAIDAVGRRFLITNQLNPSRRQAVVFGSVDGGASWTLTHNPEEPAISSTDVDIVATRTGRLIAILLDYAPAITFHIFYSDDQGASWHPTLLNPGIADSDRPWLAVGPDDPSTHLPRVYLLYHNLASGTVTHNMFVSTSSDNGASFGPPVGVTSPPSQEWQDLQCADSGGPSSIAVSQQTGRIYVAWGSRTSDAAGGCGASVTPGPFEVNVVAATRVWVATSPDNAPGSWSASLAVDDSQSNKIVSYQLSPAALDSAGNVYVAYDESTHAYPNYDGASLKYRWSDPELRTWHGPVQVEPAGDPGNVLPHIIAGAPGKIDIAYQHGETLAGHDNPVWYTRVAQVLNALDASPTPTIVRVSDVPAFDQTASILMGACTEGPLPGVTNNTCGRSTDVWAIALDANCMLTISWSSEATDPSRAPGADPGTYVARQTGGDPLGPAGTCNQFAPATNAAVTPSSASSTAAPAATPFSAGGTRSPAVALLLVLLGLAAAAGAAAIRVSGAPSPARRRR